MLLYSHWKPEKSDWTRAMFQTCYVWLGPEQHIEQTMKGTNSKHVGVWFAYSLFLKYVEAEGWGRWAATDFLFVFLYRGKNIPPAQRRVE